MANVSKISEMKKRIMALERDAASLWVQYLTIVSNTRRSDEQNDYATGLSRKAFAKREEADKLRGAIGQQRVVKPITANVR